MQGDEYYGEIIINLRAYMTMLQNNVIEVLKLLGLLKKLVFLEVSEMFYFCVKLAIIIIQASG